MINLEETVLAQYANRSPDKRSSKKDVLVIAAPSPEGPRPVALDL